MASNQEPDISTPLLTSTNRSKRSITTTISILLLISFTVVAATASSRLFPSSSLHESARPLTKLTHPVVVLISTDGFRFGYQFKTKTPHITRLIKSGTEAETGLIPVFPTQTFTNHYSIATGLYPAYHGIVQNRFQDPSTGKWFSKSDNSTTMWLGEPIWATVANHGMLAAASSWPGMLVHRGKWECTDEFCFKHNASLPNNEQVDKVLAFFDRPPEKIPHFMTLYFTDPDAHAHEVGPDHPSITEAVANIDKTIGRFIEGLESRSVFEDVHILLVSDHGIAGTCDQKVVILNDLTPWIDIPEDWVESYFPVLAIRPPASVNPAIVVAKMNKALKSGRVNNGEYLKVYLKEKLPKRLHYWESDRIAPIIGMVGEGFMVQQARTGERNCRGMHGYDNELFSMRAIFVGHGPRFARGRKVASFENVQVYNLVTSILNINGAPNNGSASFPHKILLPNSKS